MVLYVCGIQRQVIILRHKFQNRILEHEIRVDDNQACMTQCHHRQSSRWSSHPQISPNWDLSWNSWTSRTGAMRFDANARSENWVLLICHLPTNYIINYFQLLLRYAPLPRSPGAVIRFRKCRYANGRTRTVSRWRSERLLSQIYSQRCI